MRQQHVLALAVVASALMVSSTTFAREEVPTYTNAVVVSLDKAGRTLVVRNTQGVQERFAIDDGAAGLADVRPGDHVILTLRGEPGRSRVSAVVKSVATPPSKVPAIAATIPPPAEDLEGPRRAFELQVAALADQANRVDGYWSQFVNACSTRVDTRYDDGREWFAVWDATAHADLSNGFCRDLYNQIIGLGETVKRSMSGAEELARKSLEPGDIRQVRQRYALDWDGWDRAAPARLTP
jgi:hypothetical protein